MPQRSLNLRGKSCPIPIVYLAREMKLLGRGDEVEIVADDPAFPVDVTAWCGQTRHELVFLQSQDGVHRAWVRKAAP